MKCFKYFLSMFAFLASFIVSINVHAEESVHQEKSPYEQAFSQAISYFQTVTSNTTSNWNGGDLTFDRSLYDFQGNEIAYLFQVQNGQKEDGYIIVGLHNNMYEVLESTREGKSPYNEVKKSDSIYLGPLSYYKKTSTPNEYTELLSNKTYTKSEIKVLSNTAIKQDAHAQKSSYQFSAKENLSQSVDIPNYNFKILNGVINTTAKNGPIIDTVSNIVIYWSYNGYSRLDPNQTDAYKSIYDKLAKLIKTDSTGKNEMNNAVKGIKDYFNNVGKYSVTVNEYSNKSQNDVANVELFNKYKAEINANRPAWLNIQQHSFYGNTALTGVGYEEIFDPSENRWHRVAVVHDTVASTTLRDIYVTWNSQFTNLKAIIPGSDI
ncbi:hypothetical protein [Bacillus pseudomycoides]|uniref:hypothetical protein n=2 Tax=Bacillus pseudomycoides TaxID=64104 RepID=UPI0002D7F7F4|nr:hypothetical protein [Bacillus pseudomycoides]